MRRKKRGSEESIEREGLGKGEERKGQAGERLGNRQRELASIDSGYRVDREEERQRLGG